MKNKLILLFLFSSLFLIFYQSFFSKNPQEQKIKKVKIIFTVKSPKGETYYLASRKKTKKRKKDGLFEFPGGRLEKEETWKEALLRELQEEDPSGTLSQAAQSIISGVHCGKTYMTYSSLPWEEWEKLKNIFSEESYGFSLVGKNQIFTSNLWTKQSLLLIESLRNQNQIIL